MKRTVKWQERTVDDLFETIRGITFPSSEKYLEYAPGRIACLRTSNVQKNVEWVNLWYVDSKYVKKDSQLIQENDILLSNANSYELVGKVAIVKQLPQPATLGAFISALRLRGSQNPSFYYYQLSSQHIQQIIKGLASTTTNISNVSSSKVASIPLFEAPIEDQERIAEHLDLQFSRLEAGVAALKRAKENLKRCRASILRAACEGRLVPTEAQLAQQEGREFESGEQLLARILEERRRAWSGRGKYKEPASEPLVHFDVPTGWTSSTLDQLFANIADGDHQAPPQTKEGVHFLVIGNVRSGHISFEGSRRVAPEYAASVDPSRKPKLGDILYTLVGSFGIPVLVNTEVEFCIQRHIGLLRPHSFSPTAFAHMALESHAVFSQADQCATGTAQKTVPLAGLRRIAIPLPPLAEQERIVAEVERRFSILDQMESAIEASLSRATRLRQSILSKAFQITL